MTGNNQMSLPFEVESSNPGDVRPGPTNITKDELHQLPIRSFDGPIELVDDDSAVAAATHALQKERLLGFDTETKPVFKAGMSYPPALIQLAGENRVFIFQLQKLRELDSVFQLLANSRVIKAGIALADDLKKLQEIRSFVPAGFVEVGDLAKRLGFTQTGLRSLAGLALGFRVSKREQRSNWARAQLTPSQVSYAATDAWVSRELYLALNKRLASA